MNSRDRHSAFADSSGATLHRSGAYIAGGKDSWKTRFKRSRAALVFAPRRCFHDVVPSFDETFFVSLNLRRQPVCAWAGANHRKNGRRPYDLAFAGFCILQLDLFQLFSAGHLADLSVVENLNVFAGLHSTRKIIG